MEVYSFGRRWLVGELNQSSREVGRGTFDRGGGGDGDDADVDGGGLDQGWGEESVE